MAFSQKPTTNIYNNKGQRLYKVQDNKVYNNKGQILYKTTETPKPKSNEHRAKVNTR